MSTRILYSLVAAVALLLGCGNDRISGGGDEMGNFIRVSLRDSSGSPVAGARVVVRPFDQILSPTDSVVPPVANLVSGPDGSISFLSPGAGRWVVEARSGSIGRADTLVTEKDKSVPAETLSLGKLASVYGQVQGRNGQTSWISLAGRATAVNVDSLGNFRLDSVAPGPLGVVALDNSGSIGRKDVAIASGEKLDIGTFAAPVFLRVTLKNASGAPAAGARVLIRPASQLQSPDSAIPPPLQTLVVGTDGTVIVDTLPAGRYALVARLADAGRTDTFSVDQNATTLPGRILSLGKLATLFGHIEPRADRKTWISLAGCAKAVAVDSLGNFRLDSVAPGPTEIVAISPTGIISRMNIAVSAGETRDLGSLVSDWSGWSFQKKIYLNTGSRGISVGSTVTDLPVALRLTSSDFDISKLQSDFSDLRATREDGRSLPLSVERWDATSGTLTVWVRMDTVRAGRDSQVIVLRGGNAAAASASVNPFQSSHGWSGVWHMGQDLSDMTEFGNDADDASTTYKSGGAVGECRWFTRSTPGRMSVAKSPSLDPAPTGDLLLEAWVRLDTNNPNGFDPIVSRGNTGYRLQRDGTSNYLAFALLDSTSATDTATVKVVGKTNFADGQFHHVAGMRRGDSIYVFVDGLRDGQKLYRGTTKSSTSALDIGTNGSKTYWEGMIDELRIGRVSRSDDWIRLSYEGQKKSSAFVSR